MLIVTMVYVSLSTLIIITLQQWFTNIFGERILNNHTTTLFL